MFEDVRFMQVGFDVVPDPFRFGQPLKRKGLAARIVGKIDQGVI